MYASIRGNTPPAHHCALETREGVSHRWFNTDPNPHTTHTRETRGAKQGSPTILVSLVTGDIQYYYRSDSAEYYTVYIDW